jgi:hypothetical protein
MPIDHCRLYSIVRQEPAALNALFSSLGATGAEGSSVSPKMD